MKNALNALLREYLCMKGLGLDLAWETLPEFDVEPIANVIRSADVDLHDEIHSDFQEIGILADEDRAGNEKLREAAGYHVEATAIFAALDSMASDLDRSFWTFVNYPDVFYLARRYQEIDARKYGPVLDRLPQPVGEIAERQQRLEMNLKQFFDAELVKGQHCKVEIIPRGTRECCVCWLERHAVAETGFEDDQLTTRRRRPTFKLVYEHDTVNRTLRASYKGGQPIRRELEKVFTRSLMQVDPVGPGATQKYELDRLMSHFDFPVDQSGIINNVLLRSLKLQLAGQPFRSISLQVSSKADEGAIWSLLGMILTADGFSATERIRPDLLMVKNATLVVNFNPGKNGAPKPITVRISPVTCSLKGTPRDRIIEDYLKRWGIDVSDKVTPGNGTAYQYVAWPF